MLGVLVGNDLIVDKLVDEVAVVGQPADDE